MHPPTILTTLRQQLQSNIRGNDAAIELLLVGLLSRGHVLIQGAAGVGKTTMALTLARLIGGQFRRVQFTPDLAPSDLLGYYGLPPHLPPDASNWQFLPGPIFANCVLADEINRTPPRVQAALLEAMSEGQVSLDGQTHQLPRPFFVMATQNEQHGVGTFPLPLAQLDRFALSIAMSLPTAADQFLLLTEDQPSAHELAATLDSQAILQWQSYVDQQPLHPVMARYVVDLCERLRRMIAEPTCVSMRALLHLRQAAGAQAWLQGATAIHPEHVQAVFTAVMRHRLHSENPRDIASLLAECIAFTAVP